MQANNILESVQDVIRRFFWPFSVLSIVFILWMGWSVLVRPGLDKVSTTSEVEIVDKLGERDRLKTQRDHLRDVEKLFATLTRAEERRLSGIVALELDTTELYEQLDVVASLSGVVFSSVTITEESSGSSDALENTNTSAETEGPTNTEQPSPSENSAFSKVNVQATVGALDSYEKFSAFVEILESRVPLFNLESLTYAPASDSFSLRFTAYVLK